MTEVRLATGALRWFDTKCKSTIAHLGWGTHCNTISIMETSSLEILWLRYRARTLPLLRESRLGCSFYTSGDLIFASCLGVVTGFWKDYSEEGCLEEEDLWRTAEAEPDDDGLEEIKALFDMIVGSQFLDYAYSPDAYTAWKIWRSAYETLGKILVESEVERKYRDWKIGQGKASNIE
jgi:hypothetical protein